MSVEADTVVTAEPERDLMHCIAVIKLDAIPQAAVVVLKHEVDPGVDVLVQHGSVEGRPFCPFLGIVADEVIGLATQLVRSVKG